MIERKQIATEAMKALLISTPYKKWWKISQKYGFPDIPSCIAFISFKIADKMREEALISNN